MTKNPQDLAALSRFQAFLGVAAAFADPTVRICYRCPDKAAAEAYCALHSIEMTHTECTACHRAFMAELRAHHALHA